MSQANDIFGREVLERVWPSVLGEAPTPTELQVVQAVSLGEGGYGLATYRLLDIAPGPNYGQVIGETPRSNNWGAVQAGSPPCDPSRSFEATDSSPARRTEDNPAGYYQACFRRYETEDEGCASFLRTLLVGSKAFDRSAVREAARGGSADEVAAAMHASHYFEGFGATVSERVDHYADAIEKNAASIARNLGEPMYVFRGWTGGLAGGRPLAGPILALGAAYLLWRGLTG